MIEFIILRDNNLEVFMKRIFLSFLFAMSFAGIVGCADYEDGDDESISDKCRKDPGLSICQENPGNDQPVETPPVDDDL